MKRVWHVLVTAKAAKGGSKAMGQLATMGVGELLTRFVPGEVFDEAFAIYEGDREATRRHGLSDDA